MGKAVFKLYRDLPRAKKAVEHLLNSGFSLSEISLVAAPQEMAEVAGPEDVSPARGTISGVTVAVAGPLAGEVKDGALEAVLLNSLGVPEDGLGYYQFGLLTGGVLVAVSGGEEKLARARQALREVETMAVEKAHSPGFEQARRMTESDPIDAKMTGDFRRY